MRGFNAFSFMVLAPLLFCAGEAADNVNQRESVSSRPRVAVVLSGGGARGGAHIGVLRELESAGIPIDLIVGTSYGALIGGLYATGYSTEDLELIIRSIDWNEILSNAPRRKLLNFNNKARDNRKLLDFQLKNFSIKLPIGLQAGQKVQQLLDRLSAQIVLEAGNDFDKLPIPFRAVATDILTGKAHVFGSGSLSTAMRASAAFPGLFTPVDFGDTLLVDGGIADNLPVDIARGYGADFVIAVDVATPLKTHKEEIESLIDVLNQVVTFQIEEDRHSKRRAADFVITPQLEGVSPTNFGRSPELIESGIEAARKAVPEIQKLLQNRGITNRSLRRASLLDPARFDLNHYEFSKKGVVIDEVKLEGLQNYPAAYVLERISSPSSNPVSLESLDKDVATLYGEGVFTSVSYRLEKHDQQTILTYKLQENPSVKAGLGIRYDRDYKFTVLVDLLGRNFRSSGSDFFFRGLFGDANRLELGLNRDHLFTKNFAFSPQIYYHSQERLIFADRTRAGDYSDERAGFNASLQYLLANAGRLEMAYGVERVAIDRWVVSFSQSSAKTLGRLTTALEFDTLEDFEFPHFGSLGRAEFTWNDESLGSSFSFRRAQAVADHYVSLGLENTLGFSAALGRTRGNPPFYELFYTGGAHNLSFSSARFLGLSRDEIASTDFATAGLSFRRTLKHFKAGTITDVYVGLHYNAGVFDRSDGQGKFGSPVHGFGMGFYVDSRGIGPIRIELGRANRRDLTVYFSLGHFF
ncbi:MAG TPA: patatin-like phospholipase family protein [Acidobacteriota bacterium]